MLFSDSNAIIGFAGAPITTNASLPFCSHNGTTCCTTSDDMALELQLTAMNISDAACNSIIKDVLCAVGELVMYLFSLSYITSHPTNCARSDLFFFPFCRNAIHSRLIYTSTNQVGIPELFQFCAATLVRQTMKFPLQIPVRNSVRKYGKPARTCR